LCTSIKLFISMILLSLSKSRKNLS